MEDNKNKTKVDLMYDDLYEQGYLEKDRDTFNKFFYAPGEQGYKNRKALYDDLHEQGYLESPTYEDFARGIGLHAVQQSQPVVQAGTGPAAGGRQDLVESLNQYGEGLKAQNTQQANDVAKDGARSSRGAGAESSSSDGKSMVKKPGNVPTPYTGITKTDPVTGEKYRVYTGAAAANADTVPSELQGRDLLDENGNLISARQWQSKYGDKPHLPGAAGLWNGGDLEYGTVLDSHIQKAIDLGMKHGDHSRMSTDELKAKRQELTDRYANGFTETPKSLQDAIDLNNIDYELTARHLHYKSADDMMKNHRGEADFELNKGRLNQDDLDFYEKQGSHVHNLGDNPLYVYGWQKFTDLAKRNEELGQSMSVEDYINALMADPDIESKFYAWTLTRAKKNNRSWASNINEAMDDFRKAISRGENPWEYAPDEKDVMAKYATGELDKMDADVEKGLGAANERYEQWRKGGAFGLGDTDPYQQYMNATGDIDIELFSTAKHLNAQTRTLVDETMKGGGFMNSSIRGLVNGLFSKDTWDFGVGEMMDAGHMKVTIDKVLNNPNAKLTPGEQALMDAVAAKTVFGSFFGKYLPSGYKAGETTAQAIPFIIEMATGIGEATQGLAKAAAKYTARQLSKYGAKFLERIGLKNVMETTLKALSKRGGRVLEKLTTSKAGRAITRAAESKVGRGVGTAIEKAVELGKGAVKSAVGGVGYAAIPGSIKTAGGAINRTIGTPVVTKNAKTGKLEVTDRMGAEEPFMAFMKEFGTQVGEYGSEMYGPYLEGLTGGLKSWGKALGIKAADKMGIGKLVREIGAGINESDMMRIINDFKKMGHYDGTFNEYLEEVANNVYNAAFIGDMNWGTGENGVFNKEDNIDTYLSCLYMSGLFGIPAAVSYRTPKYRAKQDVKRYGDMARGIFGARGNDWSTIETLIRDNSEEGRKQFVADLMQSGKYSKREKQIALQYAGAVYKSMGMDLGESKQKRSAGEQEAEEAYGRGYDMANLENIAETSSAYNQLRSQMEQEYGTELMERMDDEPGLVYNWVRAGAVSEEDAKKVLDYLNAKMAYEGAVDRLNDDDAAAKAAAEAHIDDRVHTEDNGGDGQIYPVALKGREGDFFVVSGNVVASDEDGNVDVNASDNDIVVVDSEGKRIMTHAKDIAQVGDAIDPEAAKAQAVAQISSVEAGVESGEDLNSEEGSVESTEGFEDTDLEDTDTTTGTAAAQGALPVSEYNQDDLVTVEVDGKQVTGIVTNGLDSDGNVTIYFDEPINGQQNWQMTPEQLNQVAVSYTSRDGETISRGETPQEPQQPQPQQQQTPTAPAQVVSEEVSGEPSDDEAIAQGTQSQVPTSGEYSVQSEEAAEPSGATQQAPAQPSLPVGEDGNADFSNATPQEAHDYIYNDPELDEDEANEVVRSYAAGAQTRLDEAQAALKQAEAVPAPKMEDYRSGNAPDVAGYKRAKRERNETIAQAQAAVDAAQREVDLWNGVQAQHMMARAAANVAANREENPAAPSALAPVSGESENNAPTPSQATPAQGQQTTESTQEPSAPQSNEGNSPMASTTPSSEEERGESAPVNETAGPAEEELTPDERIERARMEALENRAEELAESCGLPVQVARSLDDLSDSHRRQVEEQHAAGKYVNGFYDPMTKQIVLFLPDIAKNGGMRRLERTFLHEGVAHGGLRALFENAQNGIQTFDELCDHVWEMMPVVTQAQMMNYIGVQKPEDMTQEKKRIAADEYMAHLAEWGVEQSVKSRIISAVKNALRKIGVKMKLSNNDIVSLLAASRRKLNEMDKVGLNSAISEALDNDGEDEGEGVRMSTTAIFEGAGLEVSRDATDNEGKPTKEPLTDSKGNLVARIGDKEFSVDNPVKAEDLKPAKMGHAVKESSVLHMLIEDSKKYSGLSDAQADKIYQNYADLLNMYLYMGSAAMGGPETVTEAWEWLGDSVFRTIAANHDAQYSYSMDIIRVCKKNEAVIKAMSALQLREGRGATPSEIVELYRETHEDGYQVPCPVCYVFTRYIRNGKYASAAIKGMEKWGDHLPGGSDVWNVDQWLDALDKIQRETNPDYKPDGKNKMKGEELEKAKRFKKQLDQANKITVAYEKRVNALSYLLTTDDAIKAGTIKNKVLELTPERRASIEKELDIINEQYQHAVEIIAHQALSNWIKTHAIEEKDGKWQMREDARKPEDIDDYKRNALDLRLTSNTIVNYPAIQRLRKSGGSAAGKEISFASDNRLGEVVSGLGINKTNLSGYKNKYEEALNATGRARTKARNEARKRFKDATVYALMQTLRGGQRMWSWSDNIERLSPDIAINIMQLQLLGGAMQTYSKQLEGIKLAAQMGAYVNGSLMAKGNGYQEVTDKDVEERDGKLWLTHDITDEVEEYPVGGGEPKPRKRIVAAKGSYVYQAEDGKKYVLIYDDVVGVDPFGNELHGKGKKKGLFQLNQEYDRAGNILVGMNDLHVRAAMADPRVFFIIPWHASGANNHILNQMLNILEQNMTDRLDYTAMQEEKNMLERNKNTKELPEVNQRLRDLWEEGRQWAKQYKWKSGMEVDSNGDVITESQYMYRQLRALIFNGNIFEAMPSEEQYRAAVQTVESMQPTVDAIAARNEQWKSKSPEYKKSPEGKAEKKAIELDKNRTNKKYKEALHYIELHDGLIDWRDSSQHEGDAEWQAQHPKRINVEEARRMIENDEFLSQVLKRVEPIGHMTNGDNTYIYPYEYWDESSTYDTADINGKRYVEYCRRMGYKPKFSGRWGEKVTEENMNDGNFVHDPGYWKLLIDRRMYDRNGKYQWLDPVESENFEPDLVNPLKTGEEFNITQVADDKDAEDIAERVYNNMAERDGGVAKVDYGKPLDKIMDEYDAALSAGVQANVKLTDAEEDALGDMEEAMEEEGEDSGVMFSSTPAEVSEEEREVDGVPAYEANNLRFSVLDPERDADLIAELDGQEYVTVYRTMAKVNGEYYPPMDSRDHDNPKRLRSPEKLGQYTQSEERPDLAFPEEYIDKKTGEKKTRWKFNLRKSNGKSVDGVAYNPYMHTSDSALNDQFSEAQDRDDLVVVECRVPVSELDPSSYHAEKALDPVGWKPWKAGPIVSKMTGKRNLLLSRWVKPVKELSWSEVADMVSKQLGDQFDVLPSNTFSKGLRAELEKRGYQFIETDNKGIIKEGLYKGVTWSDRYYDIHPELDNRSNKKQKRAKVAEVKGRNAEAVRFSTGWHGSGSEFDRFDHSHMGEGEGAQAYGWGTYITSVEGIGRSYATESAKKNPTYYWKGQKIDRASINPLSMAYDVVEREGTIKKAISLVDRFLDNPDAHENWAEVKEILKQSKKSDFTKKPARYLYEVEIPDNNGENYISWNETLPKKHRRRIANVVRELPDDLLQRDTHGPNWLRGGFEQLANTIEREQYAGKEITERLRDALGNSRAVSEIFSKAGFVGTEYPAQYLSGGRKDGAKNYVIYNEDDIEIKDRIRFSTSAAVDALRDDERVYNDLLGKVFSGVSNETRRGIVEDAMRNRGNDFGAATEAWLGGLADDGKFADVDRRDWGRVKLALHQALMDNGVDVSEPLTDGESRYVLWKAGQVDDGVFSMAEDVVMRDRLLEDDAQSTPGVRFSTSAYDVIKAAREAASGEPQGNGYINSTYHRGEIAEGSNAGEKYTIRISDHPAKWDNFVYSEDEDLDGRVLSIVITDDLEYINEWKGRGLDEITDRDGYDVEQYILNADDVDTDMLTAAIENFKKTGRSYGMKDGEMIGIQESGDGIQFSVTPRDRAIARDQYERWMKSGRMQWLESMQDSMLGLKKLMQAIMGNAWTKVEDVAMYENPYIAENLMSSVTAAQQQAFYTEFMKPLLEEVGKLCKGGKKAREKAREELTNYLMAKHGLERNQVLADRDAQETAQAGGNYQDAYAENRERDYSGLTALTGEDDVHAAEAKAQQMVDDYEAQHDTTELWSRINAATQVTLEKQYKSGMLSYAEYQRISGMFDYYVPLRGWEETTSDEVYGYLTSKAGPFLGGGIVKRAEGRTSKADDPIATIAQMGDDSIRTGNRNLMKQTFLNFVQNHPSDAVSVSDLWLQYDAVTDEWIPVFADIDPNDSADVVEQKIQDFEQHMQELAEQEPDKYKHGREAANIPYRVIPGMEKEHQVLVKRNGQTWVLTINGNPRAAQALNGLTNPDVPMEGAWASMIKGAEWVNRTLSALYTTLSPAFIVSNFLRDTGYSNTMVWVRESPNYALRFNKNYLKLNPGTLRWLLGKWEEGTLDESKPLQKHFKEFMLNGGETGFAMVQDLEKYKKNMLNEVKGMNSKNFVKKGVKLLGSQYELLGRSIENCARFAAYVTSREMGRSAERAAYDAKEISVNFNKKGSGGKSLGKVGQTKTGNVGAFISGMARSLYTFWNAGVQGMTNAGRAVKRHPVKAALLGVGPLYTAGFLAPVLAQLMGAGGDGDDDKNAYYNLPEYVRRSNLCIWLGDAWLTIPLPIEFRSIYGLGELTYGVISGNERYTDEELAMQIAGQFSQLLPIDMLEGGGGFHPFIPTLFKPIVEAEQNKSWSGLPIYRSSEWNKDDPEYTKAFSNANEWIVSGAEWLNAKTGGDEFKKGWIDLNPAKIEYMLKGYLGGIYTTIDEVRRAAETAFGKRDFEWRNIPLANRVIKQGDERTESKKLRDEYFKYKDDYENTKHLINKYKNAENTDLFDYAKKLDLLNNSKEYGRYLIFEKYATMLEAYQKAKKGASGEVLKKIEENEKVLMRQLVDEMHAFEDGKLTVGDRPKLSKKDRSEDYGYMYNNLRTYVDINEDALLDSGLKRAKASGNKGMAAALNSIKRSIGEMKKGLGRGNDEKVMNSIRRMREGVLRSFGLLDGGEVEPGVEPDVPETEEPQEDWGDEGQDNVPEPDDLDYDDLDS